jgi:hypothetical protein
VLLIPFLLIVYIFTGFPLHSIPVNRTVNNYIAKNYPGFDIVAGRTWYDWYDGKYITKIHDRNDNEIYFEVWYTKDLGIIDRYTYGYCWEKRIRKMITPLLEEKYGDKLTYNSMGHELFGFYVTVSGVNIGQQFDKDAPIRIEGNFSVAAKDTEPATLAAEFVKYRDFIEENDFSFESYLFRFRRSDGRHGLMIRVQTEQINDGLIGIIAYMQENLDERGSYYDGGRGLHYTDWSFIDG